MEAKRCWTHSLISAAAGSAWPAIWKAWRYRCKGPARSPSSCDWRPGSRRKARNREQKDDGAGVASRLKCETWETGKHKPASEVNNGDSTCPGSESLVLFFVSALAPRRAQRSEERRVGKEC